MNTDKLSKTAAYIAIKFYGLSRMGSFQQIFDDRVVKFYEQLVQELPAPLCYYHDWLKNKWVRAFFIRMEELLLPGDLLHIIARKWYMQKIAEPFIQKGFEQVVVLGAGYDHLPLHFAKEKINSIELDLPQMARQKKIFYRKHYPEWEHPKIIKAFLSEKQLLTILQDHPEIHSGKRTLVIAEGLFDYMKKQQVEQLLDSIQEYFRRDPVLISTHFALDELSLFYRLVYKCSVKFVGEELQFGTSMDDFKTLLADSGFGIRALYDSGDMRQKMSSLTGTSLPMLRGFYLFTAD